MLLTIVFLICCVGQAKMRGSLWALCWEDGCRVLLGQRHVYVVAFHEWAVCAGQYRTEEENFYRDQTNAMELLENYFAGVTLLRFATMCTSRLNIMCDLKGLKSDTSWLP